MGAELDSCSAGEQQPGAAQVGSVKCFALIFPALGPGRAAADVARLPGQSIGYYRLLGDYHNK